MCASKIGKLRQAIAIAADLKIDFRCFAPNSGEGSRFEWCAEVIENRCVPSTARSEILIHIAGWSNLLSVTI
jgi:hypothetical protein